MIKEYDYVVETVMGNVYKVTTNDPDPKITVGSKLAVKGSLTDDIKDIKVIKDSTKLVNLVRELKVAVHSSLPHYRTFWMKIADVSSPVHIFRNPVVDNTGKFYIADRNGIALDKYGHIEGETRYFNRRSDASNSLNKRKWVGATVKQA